MVEDFNDKLAKLNSLLKEILGELEGCSIDLCQSYSEQALETIYDFADNLAYIENSRFYDTKDGYTEINKQYEYDIDDEAFADEELEYYCEEDEDSEEN